MSLLDAFTEDFIILKRIKTSDGYGGYNTTYQEAQKIKGAMIIDQQQETRKADAPAVNESYTFTYSRTQKLRYYDVLKRVKDNKTFRVTSNGEDKKTPHVAHLDMEQVTCEEWEVQDE